MLTYVDFVRFRGFRQLRVNLAPHAYIVGPNSAGKSTVLEAIGLAERCLRAARRQKPSLYFSASGRGRRAYPLPPAVDQEEDPVRFDFGREQTSVSVTWDSGGRISIVWPQEGDDEVRSHFFLEDEDGAQPRTPGAVRDLFPPVTVFPVVTPLDRVEELKSPEYVQQHTATRLASRHFRNQCLLMSRRGEWDGFKEYCRPWLHEIELQDVVMSFDVNRLGVFYTEAGSRVPKELAWAGDGIQIFVQLLWHAFRAGDAKTIVLDEPEVYLHPDLQRRLVRLLDGLSAQIVLASHSADVISEAPRDGVVWVDRRGVGAQRARSQRTFSALSESLGSSYDLALVRSMRTKLVVACSCDDVRMLRVLARNIGAANLCNEQLVNIVQLRELPNANTGAELSAALREVLPKDIPAVVVMQPGYRPAGVDNAMLRTLAEPGIRLVFWSLPELENFVLDSQGISKVSGAAPESIDLHIAEACSGLRDSTRSEFVSSWVRNAENGKAHEALLSAEQAFDALWSDPSCWADLVSGRKVIDSLNGWFERDGYKPISGFSLAKVSTTRSLSPDLIALLTEMDVLAGG